MKKVGIHYYPKVAAILYNAFQAALMTEFVNNL
jgi:hypothetical protein